MASLALALAWSGDVQGQSGATPNPTSPETDGASSAAAPTLAEPALLRRLAQTVTLAWTDQQLAAGLARLGEVQGLPLWLDRRVDAGREIDLAINNRPLVEVLDGLADDRGNAARQTNVGWTALRSVIYVGPADAAREMATFER